MDRASAVPIVKALTVNDRPLADAELLLGRVSAALAVMPAGIEIKAGHVVLLADRSKVGLEQTRQWLAKVYQ